MLLPSNSRICNLSYHRKPLLIRTRNILITDSNLVHRENMFAIDNSLEIPKLNDDITIADNVFVTPPFSCPRLAK